MCIEQNTNHYTDERKNPEGYFDLTAYDALKNIEKKEEKVINDGKFHKLLNSIFNICELSDFEIQGRIILKDKKSGKIYR